MVRRIHVYCLSDTTIFLRPSNFHSLATHTERIIQAELVYYQHKVSDIHGDPKYHLVALTRMTENGARPRSAEAAAAFTNWGSNTKRI
jgi:hypothetical protein